MSGRHVTLAPGRYTLHVAEGAGPAGIRRGRGAPDVVVGVGGGRVDFTVGSSERVFYWWRGPQVPPGVKLLGLAQTTRRRKGVLPWPKATTG
jgi:hypothetical protein